METKKNLCSTCHREKGIAICVGCYQLFCYEHLAEHRHELTKILEEIVITDDRVTQLLNQQLTNESEEHPLIKRINEWETNSIETIRQTAAEARQGLFSKIPNNLLEIKTTLANLTDQVHQVRQNNGFLEPDLEQWQEQLQRIREQLEILEDFQIEDTSSTLIYGLRSDVLSIPEIFKHIVETTILDDKINGALRSRTASRLEVYGKYELTGGKKIYRFKIEELDHNRWVFFGVNAIISDTTTTTMDTSNDSIDQQNWSDRIAVYQAGAGINLPTADLVEGDIITLLIDCDERLLQLTNERMKNRLEMPIDIDKCPLPWQLHINLHQGSTRLRLI